MVRSVWVIIPSDPEVTLVARQPLQELIPRYVKAWNEPDPVHRRAELTSLYAADGRIVTQSSVYAGIGAVVGHVGDVYDQFIAPGHCRFAGGGAVAHHDGVLFRWEMRQAATNELADAGMNLFLLSGEGRIAADYQFTLGIESSIGSNASMKSS